MRAAGKSYIFKDLGLEEWSIQSNSPGIYENTTADAGKTWNQ